MLGASGGVGLAAVEIGKAMGARVIAGASSDEKLVFARRYGAAETINTASDDMRARLKEIAPKGVDVVYDPVGGALTEAALRSLAWKGRLLVIGFASGEIPARPSIFLFSRVAISEASIGASSRAASRRRIARTSPN